MKMRLRHVAQVNPLSPQFDRVAEDTLVPFLPMENVWPGDKLDLTQVRPKSAVAVGYTRFQSGDVAVPKITPTFEASRAVLIPDLPDSVGTGTTELHIVRPGSGIEPRYLLYIFHSHDFLKLGAAEMYGVAGQKRVPDDLIRNWTVDLPPLDEQRRIADFLDAETARIDELISLRKRQVIELSEALDSEAVRTAGRHGLSTSDATRTEWQRVALRRVVDKTQTGTTPTELLRPALNSDRVPWYTPAALGGVLDLSEADKAVDAIDLRYVPRFPAESILIVGIGESLGKVADLDHEATGNQQLTAITTSNAVDRRFLAWQLFTAHDEIRSWAQYSRIRILNNDVLKSFTVSIPSLTRQVGSRMELDRRLADLRAFRATAARFSLLASERRRALITAAVTGQIDVTTARRFAPSGGGSV